MGKVKIGVVGCGYLGKFHAEKYFSNPKVELTALVDTDSKKFKHFKSFLNVNKYKDYKEIIGIVDAVSIVTPTNTHFKIAKKFIENKKHVFIEKPMVEKVSEAKKLKLLEEKYNVVFQVGHLERFNNTYLKYLDYKDTPLFIESNRISPNKVRGTEVDVVLDLMIHDIDLLQDINKCNIKKINASGISVLTKDIDIANVRLEFENNCVANITASRISNKSERKMRIFQKNGYYSLDFLDNILEIHALNAKKNMVPKIKRETYTYPNNDSIRNELDCFVECILKNKKPKVTSSDGQKALSIASKIISLIKK